MAVILNGKKIYGITIDEVEKVRDISHLKVSEISEQLNLSLTSVSDTIRALDLRPRYFASKIPKNKKQEYEADLANPLFTHAQLGYKWGLSPEAIGASRKRRNLGHWRSNTHTTLELTVHGILNKLDIAYLTDYKISSYSIDMYLGHHICLDVHGTWAHSSTKSKNQDLNKIKFLLNNNYYYLSIEEPELKNIEALTTKIKDYYWVSLRSNAMLKTL